LQKGAKTEAFLRFSTVAGERGAADAERDVRGFALRFYTEEGNWDMVGDNTPIFFVRDALKFPDFIHTQKWHPRTNMRSPTAMWDFWSLSPESLHQVTILMSDRGLPQSYRNIDGFGSHAYSFINASDPEQCDQFDTFGHFDVSGSTTGKKYRIHFGVSANVQEIDEDGTPKRGWCFVPAASLVPGDVMLAQKIAAAVTARAST